MEHKINDFGISFFSLENVEDFCYVNTKNTTLKYNFIKFCDKKES